MAESALVLQAFVNGIMLGSIVVLFAMGLSLVFGIMRIINFAHGEIYMLGGYGIWALFAEHHVNYFLAMVLTMAGVALVGIVMERLFFKRFRGKLISGMVVAMGLILIMQTSALLGFGILDQSVPTAPGFGGVITVLGASLSRERLFGIIIAVLLVVLLHLFLQRTKPGKAMRATAQEPEGAALLGVRVDSTCSTAMAVGCALAAAAGVLAGSLFYVNPYVGAPWLLKGFAAIVLGGVGSIPGTILGGLIIGLVESFSSTYIGGQIALALVYSVIIVVLLIKPSGLFGLPFSH